MKFNVKGLAFVGFAAAILSANAMAAAGDERIVTSKAYVDSTFQPIGSYEVTTSKETSKESLTTNKASTTNYPSNKAITDYVDDMVSGGISTNAQAKSSENYQMGGANGTWKTVETDSYVTVAQGTTADDVKISIDDKVTNAGSGLTATGATATNLTTEKAVVEYVNDGTLTITVDGTATTFSANSATSPSVSVSVPVKAVSLNGSNVAPDASGNVALTDVESTTNKTQTIASSSTTTEYPSAKAVYDYIQTLPGAVAVDTTNCTQSNPCAFVAAWDSAQNKVVPQWIPMAQN